MAEEQLHARDKIVQQMSRQGLTEENITQGIVKNISQRQEEINYSNHVEPSAAYDQNQNKDYYLQTEKQSESNGVFSQRQEKKPEKLPDSQDTFQDAAGEAMETEAEDDIPSPAEEFVSLINRITTDKEDTGIENEVAESAEKLLDKKKRKQTSEIKQRREHIKKRLLYENHENGYDDEEEEGKKEENKEDQSEKGQKEDTNTEKKHIAKKRLKEDKTSKLNFDEGEEKEEEKNSKKKTIRRLVFEEEEREEEEKEEQGDKQKYSISNISGKRKPGSQEKGQSHGRLQFEEDEEEFTFKDSIPDKLRHGVLRKVKGEAEREEEEKLDFGAGIACQYLRETERLAGIVSRGRQLERLQYQKMQAELERQQTGRSEKLKEGSRYFKEAEKENVKKAYQKKYHQQKAIETTQRAIRNSQNAAKAKKAVQIVAAAAKTSVIAVIAVVILILALIFGAGYILFNLFHMGEAGIGAIYSGLYQSTYSDISDCESYFRELETDLEEKIANIEEEYPDCYEYVYDLGNIGHKAVDLISYLSVKYTDFTLEMCQDELHALFAEMYTLTIEIKEEPRERQKTDEDGNGIYDEDGDPVMETFTAKICYITLKVKPWEQMMEERLTEEEKSRYKVYVASQGAQQIYGNPLTEDWKDKISSRFGYRIHPITKEKTFHSGLDIAVPVGTPLYSCTEGTVTISQYSETAGNYIVVLMDSGYSVKYMHLDSLGVQPGEKVTKGMLIGATGNTGRSTGPHLHLEVRTPDNKAIDPTFIIANGAIPEEGEQ